MLSEVCSKQYYITPTKEEEEDVQTPITTQQIEGGVYRSLANFFKDKQNVEWFKRNAGEIGRFTGRNLQEAANYAGRNIESLGRDIGKFFGFGGGDGPPPNLSSYVNLNNATAHYSSNNNLQKASIADGNVSIFDVANIGIGIYGYGLAQGQKLMIAEAIALKNKNTLTSLAKLTKLTPNILRADKLAKGFGIAGAALSLGKVSYNYFNGKDLTAGDVFDVGFSIALAVVTISNPVAIVGFAAYGILDATGALDSIKSSLGGDTVVLKSNFNK